MGKSIQQRLREKKPPRPTMQRVAHVEKLERERGNAAQRGYDSEWQKLRVKHLAKHPACVVCGIVSSSNHVDHVVPHRGDDRLRLDENNLQTRCPKHHSQKTVTRDGGFGREKR